MQESRFWSVSRSRSSAAVVRRQRLPPKVIVASRNPLGQAGRLP